MIANVRADISYNEESDFVREDLLKVLVKLDEVLHNPSPAYLAYLPAIPRSNDGEG
jgi:hypothetical protein